MIWNWEIVFWGITLKTFNHSTFSIKYKNMVCRVFKRAFQILLCEPEGKTIMITHTFIYIFHRNFIFSYYNNLWPEKYFNPEMLFLFTCLCSKTILFPYSTKPFQMLILYLLLLQERITGTKNGLISPWNSPWLSAFQKNLYLLSLKPNVSK